MLNIAFLAVVLTAEDASTRRTADTTPLTCQPNSEQPMLPVFHIIGNVTKNADNSIKLEPINDCSGVTYYEGIWHVWHQCCQSHWDHIISKDLVHWQRLPPPIQPVTTRTWDGSISMIPKEDGGPLILYDAEDGKDGVHDANGNPTLGDQPILGVARLADPADKYLMTWKRVENNPVKFVGHDGAFPGQVWKNDDHWNFVMQGQRYQSNDSVFHTWTNMGKMVGQKEHGGQWWIPMPTQADGSPPPAGTPNYIVNVGGGDKYLWGNYNPADESFTPYVPAGAKGPKYSELEGAQGGWFGAQQANGRMFMIGWALGDYNGPAGPGITFLTRLTLLREVHFDVKTMDLVSNPVEALAGLRTATLASEKNVKLNELAVAHHVANTAGGAAASADIELNFTIPKGAGGGATFGACVLAKPPGSAPFVPHWEVLPNTNAGFAKVGVRGNLSAFLGNASTADDCLTLCKQKAGCQEFAWQIFGSHPPPAFLNSTLACYEIYNPDTTNPFIQAQPGATSGKFLTADPSSAGIGITITVGTDATMTAKVGMCTLDPDTGEQQQRQRQRHRSNNNDAEEEEEEDRFDVTRASASTVPLFADEEVISVRILPDRSVVDFFVQGGRWSGTVSWLAGTPRVANASQVSVWSSTAGVTADIDVYGMGCGWEFPAYTEHPTM